MAKINEKKFNERQKVIKKIKNYESLGGDYFFENVEDDPPFTTLMPEQVDYELSKFSSKIKCFFANALASVLEKGVKRKFQITVVGKENLQNITGGAVITSNHFSPYENVAVTTAVKSVYKHKKLYRIIREGNYFMKGLFGFLLKNARTLPLSSNLRTMMNLQKRVSFLLKRGDFILVYPEQAMWRDYKKPRPYKIGAYTFASQNNVPIIPMFCTLEDTNKIDRDGLVIPKYTIHILPPIYPDEQKTVKQNANYMRSLNYETCKEVYEKTYKTKLVYNEEKEQIL